MFAAQTNSLDLIYIITQQSMVELQVDIEIHMLDCNYIVRTSAIAIHDWDCCAIRCLDCNDCNKIVPTSDHRVPGDPPGGRHCTLPL